MQAPIWLLVGLLALPAAGRPAEPPLRGDLNGDGLADLVTRDVLTNTGVHTVWFMGGATRLGTGGFTPARVPDGDGAPTGAEGRVPPIPAWYVCGVGDFDGDGRNDAVFNNLGIGPGVGDIEIWLLEAGLAQRAVTLVGTGGCASVNDFDGDGDPDILLGAVGPMIIWLMDGTTHVGDLVPQPASPVDSNWRLVGTGDLNADGWPDLLWYNTTTRKIVQWLMNASMVRVGGRFANPPNSGDANWIPRAVADYGGAPAGVPDVIWQNATSGKLVIWWMDAGGNRVAGEFLTPDATAGPWVEVVGPR